MRRLTVTSILLLILLAGWTSIMAKPRIGAPLAPAAVRRAQNLALGALKAGNQWFLQGEAKAELEQSGKWARMEKAQKPWAMVLSCSDSRVPPEILFNRKVGDIFVCRNAGNVADKVSIAGIEYGAEHLGISLLVVLGHTECGAVEAAREFYAKGVKEKVSLNMEALLAKLEPCVKELEDVKKRRDLSPEAEMETAVRANVKNSIREILEQSPALWQLCHEQRLKIVGAVYSLKDGKVKWLEE